MVKWCVCVCSAGISTLFVKEVVSLCFAKPNTNCRISTKKDSDAQISISKLGFLFFAENSSKRHLPQDNRISCIGGGGMYLVVVELVVGLLLLEILKKNDD